MIFCVCSTNFHPKKFLGGDFLAKTKFRNFQLLDPQIDNTPNASLRIKLWVLSLVEFAIVEKLEDVGTTQILPHSGACEHDVRSKCRPRGILWDGKWCNRRRKARGIQIYNQKCPQTIQEAQNYQKYRNFKIL